jgi:hypothetical protein
VEKPGVWEVVSLAFRASWALHSGTFSGEAVGGGLAGALVTVFRLVDLSLRASLELIPKLV